MANEKLSDQTNTEDFPVEQREMSFLDHLEELRWHIIRAFLAIGVFTVAAFFSKSLVFGKHTREGTKQAGSGCC